MAEWEHGIEMSVTLAMSFTSSLCHFVTPSLSSASAFPISDWQFWVVTAVFLLAATWLLKGVMPIPWLTKRAKRKKGTKHVSLTIGGKAPDKP